MAVPKKYLDRKDLARLLDLSVRQVTSNERNLGLDAFRHDLNKRVVRYHAGPALAALRKRNLLPLENAPQAPPSAGLVSPHVQDTIRAIKVPVIESWRGVSGC